MFKSSGKRRWHRVHDGAQEKRRREDSISDKTRLLSHLHEPDIEHREDSASHPDPCPSPRPRNPSLHDLPLLPVPMRSNGYLSDVPKAGHIHNSLAQMHAPVRTYRHAKKDKHRLETWISDMDGYASDCRLHETKEDESFATASLLPNHSGDVFHSREKSSKSLIAPHGSQSWRGFKQLLRKQFMPFTTTLVPENGREEMQHLRQKRVEGADANVLAAKTNLVELRKMDAKIQDRIHKSAFLASSKKLKAKENVNLGDKRNLGSNKELTDCTKVEPHLQIKAVKVNQKLPRQMKETSIFRKVNTCLNKASKIPLQLCDVLSLE